MDIILNKNLAKGYKSQSQIARVVTEAWFEENMYCLGCKSNSLDSLQANTKVLDFQCFSCEEKYQLKSKSRKFGKTIANSEYYTKIEIIEKGLSPNWAFLQYNYNTFEICNLMIIPRHFMIIDAIKPRKPLSDKARRAGWVGSNILLNRLPPDARIYVIENSKIMPKKKVRNRWKQFEFLRYQKLKEKGWINDVLTCVRELGKKEFTLQEMYGFIERLHELHPGNYHVEAKIRQQLQVLRDNGVLEFVKRGEYRLKI